MDEQVRILCVDDEASILKSLKRLFMDTGYDILVAGSGDEGLRILAQTHPIQVVVSDYRMPDMNGVDFLKEVRKKWPETVRIVLSGYADMGSIVSAINEGQIYKFIAKPWNDDELRVAIANSIERYFLHKKNIELTDKLKDMNEELRMLNENLEKLVEERTQELIFQNQALRKSQNILDALPLAVVGLDLEGQICLCNRIGTTILGDSILGMDRLEVFSPETNAFIDTLMSKGSMTKSMEFSGRTMKTKGMVMEPKDGQEGLVLVLEEE